MIGGQPKPEIRGPQATRRPEVKDRCRCGTRLPQTPAAGLRAGCASLLLGIRICTSAACLLALTLSLSAASPAPTDDIPPLRPPHAEILPGFWEQYGLWVTIFGLLLLALLAAAAWFLTRPGPPVVVPPEVQARAVLEPLRQQPEDGALLSRVSQVLRHYVAAAFDLPAGELTTSEFCRAIDGHARIGPEISAAVSEFLRQCDQRKFSLPLSAPPLSAVPQALKLIELAQARRLAVAPPEASGARMSPPPE